MTCPKCEEIHVWCDTRGICGACLTRRKHAHASLLEDLRIYGAKLQEAADICRREGLKTLAASIDADAEAIRATLREAA